MAQNVKNIDLNLAGIEVLTPGNVAEFVNRILEFLLFQRRQIPFVYKTYKYYIEKWSEQAETRVTTPESFANYQLQQQRVKASETKEAISDMREIIRDVFKLGTVKTLRFLFGSTIFLPKEVYTIHIPRNINRRHYSEHHAMSQGSINQILLTLLTCEELYHLFSTDINATNIFLEVQLYAADKDQAPQLNAVKLFPKNVERQLPRSCKNVHLHLLHKTEKIETQLQCCKDLNIYEDLDTLNRNGTETQSILSEACHKDVPTNDCKWWQAEGTVRGFRTRNQNSSDLWSSSYKT